MNIFTVTGLGERCSESHVEKRTDWWANTIRSSSQEPAQEGIRDLSEFLKRDFNELVTALFPKSKSLKSV